MDVVSKVRDSAGGLYEQAKAKYTGSDKLQKAGHQAGRAAGQLANHLTDAAGKASGAVKARAARRAQRHPPAK